VAFLYSVVGFLIAIGVLVAVHEFGHFWVARKLGVKVLTYSIGFGKPIWRKVAGPDQIEYVIAQIPLGGYVKFLGEGTQSEPIDPKDSHRTFDGQPIWKRALIVAAGPGINFLFAIILFMFIGMQTEYRQSAVFGQLDKSTVLAELGVSRGDTLISIDGKPARFLAEHQLYVFNQLLKRDAISVEIESNGARFVKEIETANIPIYRINPSTLMRSLGFVNEPVIVTTDVDRVVSGSAAAAAGIKKGDTLLSIGGVDIAEWDDVTRQVQPNPSKPLSIVVQRDGGEVSMTVTPEAKNNDGDIVGVIGVGPKILPAVGTEIIEIKRSLFGALSHGINQTWQISTLSIRMLGKMITLQVSYENISGPLTIADTAGQAIQVGIVAYLSFIALISISLGVMNLLPIPMLDGGHLATYVIEVFAGKELSQKFFVAVQPFGLLMLAGLMSLAFYNDILRLFN